MSVIAMRKELPEPPVDIAGEAPSRPRAFLDLSGVSIDFPTRKGPFRALDDVNLKIAKGEFVSIIGHSGCGKSTVPACIRPPKAVRSSTVARSISPGRSARWCSRTTRCCPG